MLKFVSNIGGTESVDFETAILNGFAENGGLYVPESLPTINLKKLKEWKKLSFVELAFEIVSLFVDRKCISTDDLKGLLEDAYSSFESKEIIPIYKSKSINDLSILELFHGPTISFKDIGLAFLVNLVNYFLKRKGNKMSIIVATTGDTGPAAAYFSAGKSNIDIWVLYPKGMITEEQEIQMTSLQDSNVHPVGVLNCPDGGDDLDLVIANLFADETFKSELNLSSVNSINWGRVMIQTVHYFYAYLKTVKKVGDKVHFSVPSGAFGNLCAGSIARKMGLPVDHFIVANNKNACLHRIFSKGIFSKKDIHQTVSSAIDILIPYNFWRYLYFALEHDADLVRKYYYEFKENGKVKFPKADFQKIREGFISASISDKNTLKQIQKFYSDEDYLLDPHAAVAMAAAKKKSKHLEKRPIICLATAHPAKFPEVIKNALNLDIELPPQAFHHSLETAKKSCQKLRICEFEHFESALRTTMMHNWNAQSESN